MKKILTSILVVLIIAMLSIPVLAADEDYVLRILVDKSSSLVMQSGDVVTVELCVAKKDAKEFDLFAMQDYICFDTEYFEIISDSIEVHDGFYASPVSFNQHSPEFNNMVFINCANTTAQTIISGEILLSFQLKALKEGSTIITHDGIEILTEYGNELECRADSVSVVIRDQTDIPTVPDIPVVPSGPSLPDIPSIPSSPTNPSVPNIPILPSTPDNRLIPFIPYNATENKFIDIVNHWAENVINVSVCYGLFNGIAEDLFAPDMAMTRGMVVTVLSRIAQVNSDEYSSASFVDISGEEYYAASVNWAAVMRITSGIGNGLFGPNNDLTREQLAVMVYNFLVAYGYVDTNAEVAASNFVDNDMISSWAQTAVRYCAANGIVVGYPNGNFGAKDIVDRAQAAAILVRIVEKYINK